MLSVNIKTVKKCAFCKYWYDPINSAINPKSPQINVWEYDDKAKKMCLQTGLNMSGGASCGKYICKVEKIQKERISHLVGDAFFI